MQTLELNLLDNALDSLNESISKFKQGKSGSISAYKFAILHFTHFIELFFKYFVSKSHPLLIYKNPFSKKIENQNTISLWESIQFLRNEGKEIPESLSTDLEWIKSIRNQIEHFKFTMNIKEVEETLGRLMHSILAFQKTHSHPSETLLNKIEKENIDILLNLAANYEEALQKALLEVEEERKKAFKMARFKEYDQIAWQVTTCIECKHLTFISDNNSKTGYRCTYCGNVFW